jgi:hypothetical protein
MVVTSNVYRTKWQQFTLCFIYYYCCTDFIIWLVWFVSYQCWEDIDVIVEMICGKHWGSNILCRNIYSMYI